MSKDNFVPSEPQMQSALNIENSDGNYTLTWDKVDQGVIYMVQEATDVDFQIIVREYPTSNTTFSLTAKPIGTYYYRVKRSLCNVSSRFSSTTTVTIGPPDATPPKAPGGLGVN